MPELRVRAGVLTGNAAVEVGAEGEGMVLGDTVNTASRLQSIAAPGTVLVDDVTRRASEAAIAYEDAGEHQRQRARAAASTRGPRCGSSPARAAPAAAPGSRRRSSDATRAAARSSTPPTRAPRRPRPPGHGRRRGRLREIAAAVGVLQVPRRVEEERYWHQGRCLSYGEGVAYWALAEMVRARAGIAEEEAPDSARRKLADAVATFVTDERERRLVEPRLAHLLRLEERTGRRPR